MTYTHIAYTTVSSRKNELDFYILNYNIIINV